MSKYDPWTIDPWTIAIVSYSDLGDATGEMSNV
jgi:hypothetical protein